MTPLVWTSVGVLASSTVWLLAILAGRDVYDWLRRRFPTARQRHTLPSVRADRFDATESEVAEIPDLLRRRQPANWRDQGPYRYPAQTSEPAAIEPPIIPGPRPYRARHSTEDRLTTTERFEAIAASAGAPVREHGPRETWLADLSVSAT